MITVRNGRLKALRAEQKEISRKIKELEKALFKGVFFRVRPTKYAYLFRVQLVHNPQSWTTLITLTLGDANRLAEKLEGLWPQ